MDRSAMLMVNPLLVLPLRRSMSDINLVSYLLFACFLHLIFYHRLFAGTTGSVRRHNPGPVVRLIYRSLSKRLLMIQQRAIVLP